MLYQTLQLRVKAGRVARLRVNNLLVYVHGVVVGERRMSSMHLIDQNTKGPPVDGLAMTLVEEDLWCDILRCAANGVGAFGDDFCEAVVDQFEVAIVSDHNVLRLQVAINDVFAVQVLEDTCDLRAIKPILISLL